MDKTTKLILGLIAVSLIGINIQMWDGKLVKDAKANTGVTKIAICEEDGDISGDGNYLNEKIIIFTNIYPFILKKQEFNKNICKELYLL